MVDPFTRTLLTKDLTALMKSAATMRSFVLHGDVLVEDNILEWDVFLIGAEGTLYEGGVFKCNLKFPQNYPNEPPVMKFCSDMWHPNVYDGGKVCISILHKPGGTAEMPDDTPAEECWRPILGVEAILMSVVSMLSDPNFSSPANIDASVQMKNDPEGFKARVAELCERSKAELPADFVMPAAEPAAGGARAASSLQGASAEWDAGQSASDEEIDESDAELQGIDVKVLRAVMEMGFEKGEVVAMIRTMIEKGKVISAESVTEKLMGD